MAKSAHNRSQKPDAQKAAGQSFIAVDKNAFDPTLSSLFEKSSGPVTTPPKSRYQSLPERKPVEDSSEDEEEDDEDEESAGSDDEQLDNIEETEDDEDAEEDLDISSDEPSEDGDSTSDHEAVLSKVRESILNGEQDRPNKKRKRANKEEDVEDTYMRKLAREQEKEEEQRKKKQKTKTVNAEEDTSSQSEESDGDELTIPKHETQMDSADGNADELEKAARTVFLGNVSSEAITSKSAKKTLLRHLGSFISDLADHTPPHKVESIRFRSTAFASAVPKRAAFAKKEVMDATTKSTNAYAVYSTQLAANKAAKQLNGTVVLGRHLRVDSVAHPAKVDHRRCVFVGNLGFVDDESTLEPKEGEKKKNKPPGDVEEGLWTQFSKAGKVESVRVVRDAKTRVGKGIAYVQFQDENGVEAALQFNEQKYPPLLPRKLRVVRAKAPKKTKKPSAVGPKSTSDKKKGVYNAKVTEEQKTSQGRAKAMLGKAGAFKSAESFVFEGHRASSNQGNSGLKLGGKKKGKGKLSNRSAKRAAAWKKSGGKK